ncbi:hypothetical protein [Pseudomarimonas arenosa]|uniref:Uncharacterized protein n=1 Tax=Pseudomarimonas arenosa TaxID=2774145 RepID=A0AAW3ZQL5_9GAMM|nr:hypothetical protein [Pseudomarimonas arenosa]MBD8526882.1 hypothetical protein [Pseudomarimonas arenosa]
MAVICLPPLALSAPRQTGPDFEHLRGWVLRIFDCARRRARRSADSLSRLHRLADARARRLAERALGQCDAYEGPLEMYRWRQVCRLCQLAPAAVEWVARHLWLDDEVLFSQFRSHLDRRCLSIINEMPHDDVLDD